MNTYDVAIVGGGVIGGAIAFELAAAQLRVVVLDRQQPGREASWAAGGMLSPAPHMPPDISLVPFGKASLQLYPELVAAVEEASGKRTGYAREGALEIFPGPDGEAERDATVAEHRRLGLAAEAVSPAAARDLEAALAPAGSPGAWSALWLPEEGTVEPRLLTEAVLLAAERRGVEIRSGCRVTSLMCESGRCAGAVAGGERIAAKHVVVAAGCFSGEIALDAAAEASDSNKIAARYAPTRPVRGQMLALRKPPDLAFRRVLRSRKGGYLVPQPGDRILAGSTLEEAGYEKCVTAAGLGRILGVALELVPALADAEIVETWAGLRPGTPDDLPILGPTDVEGLLMATGHYRNGILHAPITAKLIRDWIVRGQVDFGAECFSPLRFSKREPQHEASEAAPATSATR